MKVCRSFARSPGQVKVKTYAEYTRPRPPPWPRTADFDQCRIRHAGYRAVMSPPAAGEPFAMDPSAFPAASPALLHLLAALTRDEADTGPFERRSEEHTSTPVTTAHLV